jgi:magnesium transporter
VRPGTHRRKTRARPRPPGAAPGAYELADGPPAEVRVVAYGPSGRAAVEPGRFLAGAEAPAPTGTTWVDVDGIDRTTLEALTKRFHLHPLAVEDAVHTHQRAKVEAYPNHDLLIARMVTDVGGELVSEQVSFFIGATFVLSMQELPGDPFDPVRARLDAGDQRLCQGGPDHLVYALVDAVVDHYFPILERVGDRIEALEAAVVEEPHDDNLVEIQRLRRALILLRRNAWPMRDMLQALVRGDVPFVTAPTRVYLRDTLDHLLRITDLIESYREMVTGLMDLHMSAVSMRMNGVMQVLTVISTIFIPLTFIAGLYGMNFDPESSPWNMPELRSPVGYPIILGAMVAIAILLLLFFRRRGWLGGGAARARRDKDGR